MRSEKSPAGNGTEQFTGFIPHVMIIGAGFGGLQAAKSLAHLPVKATIIDRNNHHLFQPMLHQVATAGLSPADIASSPRRYAGNLCRNSRRWHGRKPNMWPL